MFNEKIFNNGIKVSDSSCQSWNAHPLYRGVYMKNFLSARDTDNKISTHLVKIEPDCTIELHVHPGKGELHEIIDGEGIAFVQEKNVDYRSGISSFIPADTPHSITAGANGLLLMAKFIPAL